MADKDFNSIPDQDLATQLRGDFTNRLLRKDISREENLPKSIVLGARAIDFPITYSSSMGVSAADMLSEANSFPTPAPRIIKLPWQASGTFGTFTITMKLSLGTVPPSLVWHLGNLYRSGGLALTAESGIGLIGSGGASSATYSYTCNKDELKIHAVTTNSGLADIRCAYFLVGLYYDDSGLSAFGL